MPTLLYGLTTSADAVPSALRGVGDAPVRILAENQVRGIVSTVPTKPTASLEGVRAHDAVLRACVAHGATVVAVRFGQVFADDEACAAGIRERGERIGVLLDENRDCVEMRVLLPVAQESTPAPGARDMGPGRAYLEALKSRGVVAPHVTLAPMIGPMVRAERIDGFASQKGTRGVAFAHLVKREDVAAYRETVKTLPVLAEARVVGPLPLYSFAEHEA